MSKPVKIDDDFRELAPDEVLDGLRHVDFRDASRLVRRAQAMAQDYTGEGRDLLHDAVTRAVVSRTCRKAISLESFLAGIMRSIASTQRRSRERRAEEPPIPLDWLSDHLIDGVLADRPAEEDIETERVRALCIEVIDRLSAQSALQARLIDGIGLDLRGRALAEYAGLSLDDLATARRKLKRHAERLWPDFQKRLSPAIEDE
ncbi:MAG: hypothetical protein OSB00_05055 [Sphingomonas bacterium]|nr:hypothetical protein [Sphingomonas bacterium]